MSNLLIITFALSITFCFFVFLFAFFLREYHLRYLVSNYPDTVSKTNSYDSLATVLKPFSDIVLDAIVEPHSHKNNKRDLLSKYFRKYPMAYDFIIDKMNKLKDFFYKRPLAYDFISNHFPSALGNLSEVARRKFSRSPSDLDALRQQTRNLRIGLQYASAAIILNSMANIYRCMQDLPIKEKTLSVDNQIQYSFNKKFSKIAAMINQGDVFNAYIELISIENTSSKKNIRLSNLSDIQLIAYMKIKIKLESFIQAYEYPVNQSVLRKKMDSIQTLIKNALKTNLSYKNAIKQFV
jgi:hypothetical protein